jgi:hypothetical protein
VMSVEIPRDMEIIIVPSSGLEAGKPRSASVIVSGR